MLFPDVQKAGHVGLVPCVVENVDQSNSVCCHRDVDFKAKGETEASLAE